MPPYTVVEYCGPQENSRCGYCVSSNTSQSHGKCKHGMWAHCMTVDDYQDLIDRGWRRSGLYCYKPNNKTTCCPSYTIKCDAQTFRLTKSHKKILKRMNAFLLNGIRPVSTNNEPHCDSEQPRSVADDFGADGDNESRLSTRCQPRFELNIGDIDSAIASTSRTEAPPTIVAVESTSSNECEKKPAIVGPDPTKPLKLKAKFLRAQRKLEKQQKNAVNSSPNAADVPSPAKRPCRNAEQTLQSLINAAPANGRHHLQVRLVPSVDAATDEALSLYKRYQIGIHKDPPQKITRKSFENFLVRSPLQITLVRVTSDTFNQTEQETFNLYKKYQTIIHHDPPENIDEFIDFLCKSPIQHETPLNGPASGYGSFHQQYWLDERLIAVGVIDILPKCVSSVYFFYDPEFSFLTLGTYGTLRELQFVQELYETVNSLSEYYMGFYIHSCPKMRYKGKLQPSYLLCPEVYTWHELNDDIRSKLSVSKYSRFNPNAEARDVNQFIPANDLNDVRLLVNYKFARAYGDYKPKNAAESMKLQQTVVEYGGLVGNVLSKRQLLVV